MLWAALEEKGEQSGVTELRLDQIRTDGGTQPRYALDLSTIDDYTDEMEAGVKFPPVVVFYDGENYWLADGFHRKMATEQTGADKINVDLRQGTLEDAQWFSFSANKTNGLRRTNDDKQRAVKAALMHPKGAGMSNSAIAKHVGVDSETVRNWRTKLESSSEIRKMSERTVNRNGTTYQQDTSRIGKRPEAEASAPDPEPPPLFTKDEGPTPSPFRMATEDARAAQGGAPAKVVEIQRQPSKTETQARILLDLIEQTCGMCRLLATTNTDDLVRSMRAMGKIDECIQRLEETNATITATISIFRTAHESARAAN